MKRVHKLISLVLIGAVTLTACNKGPETESEGGISGSSDVSVTETSGTAESSVSGVASGAHSTEDHDHEADHTLIT